MKRACSAFRRPLVLISALAVVLSGLVWGASPVSAAVSGGSITPSEWGVGTTNAVAIRWTESSVPTSIMVRSPWPWPATYPAGSTGSPVTVTSVIDSATSIRCPGTEIVFSSPQFNATAAPTCYFVNAPSAPSNWTGFYIQGGNLGMTAAPSITVSIPQGLVIAPSTPRTDTWVVGPYSLNWSPSSQAEIASTAVAGIGTPVPLITLNINGNGGSCTVNAITGYQSTWTIAPDARFPGTPGEGSCSKDSAAWVGFNTSPDGSGLAIAKGGNLHLTGDNTLYAQYAENRLAGPPTAVKATSGWNSVTVEWSAPADPGTYSISNYLVQARPGGSVCITRLTDANPLKCTFTSLNPGNKYTFAVQALTGVGWGPMSTASAEASPFDLRATSVKRAKKNILFVNVGSKLTVGGTSAGYAPGATITPWIKVGGGKWEADKKSAFKANASAKFSWTKDLPKKQNSAKVTVRFSDGTNFSNEVVLPAV